LTGIRTQGLIVFGLVHFLCATEATFVPLIEFEIFYKGKL
jgi:hypothetical protein